LQYMDDRRSRNVMRYLEAIHHRQDLTENLEKLKCRTLILVGDQSPFYHEALHINNAMNRRYNALIEVRAEHLLHLLMFSAWLDNFMLCNTSIPDWLKDVFFAG
jgi:pimeloyl-ACP methyl ester carboxylesterase